MNEVVITDYGYLVGDTLSYKETDRGTIPVYEIKGYNSNKEEQIVNKVINEILNRNDSTNYYVDLCISSTMPNYSILDKENLNSKDILSLMTNNIAIKAKEHNNLGNKIHYIASACSGGAESIIYGYEQIRSGNSNIMLCGGVDVYNPLLGNLFSRNGLISKKGICNPFSEDRDGTILSEGVAFLLLENKDHAILRKANILGTIIGTSSYTSKGYNANSLDIIDTIQFACLRANIYSIFNLSKDIDLYNAHATGTVIGDKNELDAITYLKLLDNVVAYKSMYGHTLSASAPLEIALSLECDEFNTMLKFSSGLGNTNAAIIISR